MHTLTTYLPSKGNRFLSHSVHVSYVSTNHFAECITPCSLSKREKEKERERENERERKRERKREGEREKERDIEREKKREREREGKRERKREREAISVAATNGNEQQSLSSTNLP